MYIFYISINCIGKLFDWFFTGISYLIVGCIIISIISIPIYGLYYLVIEIIVSIDSHRKEYWGKRVCEIEQKYPFAYNDFLKEYNNIGNADFKELKRIAQIPETLWNEEEKKLQIQEMIRHRRKQEREKEKQKEEEEYTRKIQLEIKTDYKIYKSDKEEILEILRDNNITCFYHFTANDNLDSIKHYGGLYSWFYMSKEKKIDIPCPGGGSLSRQSDRRYGLEDYVHLSFCDDHPMRYRSLEQKGIPSTLLKIDLEVATWEDTLFSDINATDNNHTHGGSATYLKRVNFNAVKRHFVSKESVDFKPHQAEVMVKTFIPIKYITILYSQNDQSSKTHSSRIGFSSNKTTRVLNILNRAIDIDIRYIKEGRPYKLITEEVEEIIIVRYMFNEENLSFKKSTDNCRYSTLAHTCRYDYLGVDMPSLQHIAIADYLSTFRLKVTFNSHSPFSGDTLYKISSEMKSDFDNGTLYEGMTLSPQEIYFQNYTSSHTKPVDITLAYINIP